MILITRRDEENQSNNYIQWLFGCEKKSAEAVSSAEFNWKSQALEKLLDTIFVNAHIYII